MDKGRELPTTLQEAMIHFSDFENCKSFMMKLRWPDGIVRCPTCGSDNVAYLPNAKVFKCYERHARQKFSLKVGTIFEDSPLGLDKWLVVMWMLVNCKNGVSSWEIHRAIGVTQKSAWFMLQRCRLALQDEMHGGKLGGEVEVDETYIGGKARNMHLSKRGKAIGPNGGPRGGKAGIQGFLERGGKVRTEIIDDRKLTTLIPNVQKHVDAGSVVYTDEANAYFGLQADFSHEVINHAVAYVLDNVHTNGIENFWSLLKRTLAGTYVSVEPFHLDNYLNEQVFRYNNRATKDNQLTDADRFALIMSQVGGKRLTYA